MNKIGIRKTPLSIRGVKMVSGLINHHFLRFLMHESHEIILHYYFKIKFLLHNISFRLAKLDQY